MTSKDIEYNEQIAKLENKIEHLQDLYQSEKALKDKYYEKY